MNWLIFLAQGCLLSVVLYLSIETAILLLLIRYWYYFHQKAILRINADGFIVTTINTISTVVLLSSNHRVRFVTARFIE